jgi:hypothetical protein
MIITYPIESDATAAIIDDITGLQDALDNRVRFDAAQVKTDAERIQAQQNAGFTLNAAGELDTVTENGTKRILLND